MCGIVGLYGADARPVDLGELGEMARLIEHRGPDGHGFWAGESHSGRHEFFSSGFPDLRADVALGHRRLSIIDLTDTGRQPMCNEDGTIWITFNGEIYNFRELKSELESLGHRFRSSSDTEVIVHAYEAWGERCVDRFNGIFAFAIWDQPRRQLFLARDRLGVKPLYYTWIGERFAFGSEFKSFLAIKDYQPRLNLEAIDRYMSFLWVPDPDTVLEGVHKLPPGHRMVVKGREVSLERYWSVAYSEAKRDEQAIARDLADLFDDAVQMQLMSDVPLGAFLSGGVDSSAIVESMRRNVSHQVTTYTVGYSPKDLRHDVVPDDVRWARKVGALLGVDYNEFMLEPSLADLLPRVVWHMDEPVADPAALSAFLICKAAKQKLTVMLSGMGGDEIFGGYPRHVAVRMADGYTRLPGWIRRGAIEPLAARMPASVPGPLNPVFRNAKKLLRDASLPFQQRYLGFGTYFTEAEKQELYVSELAARGEEGRAFERHHAFFDEVKGLDNVNQMIHVDTMVYLPCLNLTYSDKMSMANSVEVRVPFLDHRLVEFAARIPPHLKLRGLEGKYILKKALRGRLPDDVIYRKKAGFGAPIRSWLKGELSELVGDLLSKERIVARGLFEPSSVARVLEDNRTGRSDNALKIWQLLTLELWFQKFMDGNRAS